MFDDPINPPSLHAANTLRIKGAPLIRLLLQAPCEQHLPMSNFSAVEGPWELRPRLTHGAGAEYEIAG